MVVIGSYRSCVNMVPSPGRQLVFDGCFNFRDLGGYPTSAGVPVLARHLYRADGPHALSDADRRRLDGLGLATVIDLRTADEASQRGTYGAVLRDVVEYHVPMIDVLPDLDDLSRWVDPEVVADRYRDMLNEGQDTLAEVLAILSDPTSYPTVVHCSAGKDRTGIVSAVLLGLLGVDDDTIVADYALSGPAMGRLVNHLRDKYPDTNDWLERVAPALIAAQPETMTRFLADLYTQYGSFDGLADTIGVGSAPRYLRNALLRPTAAMPTRRSAATTRNAGAA
jgi:protein-tyrosine phosphatase